jgi:hypothetical protein
MSTHHNIQPVPDMPIIRRRTVEIMRPGQTKVPGFWVPNELFVKFEAWRLKAGLWSRSDAIRQVLDYIVEQHLVGSVDPTAEHMMDKVERAADERIKRKRGRKPGARARVSQQMADQDVIT